MEKDENSEKKEEIALFLKEFETLKKKYDLELSINMDFPDYKIPPVELKLALEILKKHRMNYVLNFKKFGEK